MLSLSIVPKGSSQVNDMFWTYKRYMYNTFEIIPSSAFPSFSVNLLKILASEFVEGAKSSHLEYKLDDQSNSLIGFDKSSMDTLDMVNPVQLYQNVEQLRLENSDGNLFLLRLLYKMLNFKQ